jgi:hypothetical protein
MSTQLCETFRHLAFKTFDRLGRARQVGYQPLEETFTDLNILELKIRHPNDIFCHTFTKREEGRNGADWEWWLTDPGMSTWLGLRIQAKVLHLRTNRFEHLHYQSGNPAEYQATKLKRECAAEGLVPLYCFYLHGERPLLRPPARFRIFHHRELFGCSLAPLPLVEALQPANQRDLVSVIAGSCPWHYLVCQSRPGRKSLPESAWAVLTNISGGGALSDVQSDNQQVAPGPRSEPPTYVRDIIASRFNLDNDIPGSVRGIVIIRESWEK